MGDYKDFDLDLKKVENNANFGGVSPDSWTWDASFLICTPISEILLSVPDCPPNPSYGGDRGCGPTTSVNSRIIDR